MDLEIVKTDTPRRDLLLLADESEESVADYAGRGTTYVARRDGEILGQYVFPVSYTHLTLPTIYSV